MMASFYCKDTMSFVSTINFIEHRIWCLPVLLTVFALAIYLTIQLRFVQFRYFLEAVHDIFDQREDSSQLAKSGTLSPFQAFVNTLGANIGNGSLAGMAVAIHSGGPGAIFWLLLLSTFSVVFRFAEVFVGTYVIGKFSVGSTKGGPMVYMSVFPGGKLWSYLYTFFALGFMFAAGSLAQCNSVGLAIHRSWGIDPFVTSFFILFFIVYVFLGGSARIVSFLDKLVPLKVFVFLFTALIVLLYHYKSIPHALYLMGYLAWQPQALMGGSFGFALQQAMSAGFQQGIFASEAGLGTAAIAFSSTKGKGPVKNGILAMLGVYINIHLICFLVALCILASGVWNNGETSSALLISAYETVFGSYAGWIVSILVVNFAMSVLIAGAYNGKKCWDFLLNKKAPWLFSLLYIALSFYGTWMNVGMVWTVNNIVNLALLCINVAGLLWFVKEMQQELKKYEQSRG